MWELVHAVTAGLLAAGGVAFGLTAVMPLCRNEAEQSGRNFACTMAALLVGALVAVLA